MGYEDELPLVGGRRVPVAAEPAGRRAVVEGAGAAFADAGGSVASEGGTVAAARGPLAPQ